MDAETFVQQMQDALQIFTEWLESMAPNWQALFEIARDIHDRVYAAYLEHGAVYGETSEGFGRWLDDMRQLASLEEEARRIRERHWVIASTKEQLAKREKAK